MAINELARRWLGYDPFGSAVDGQPVSAPPATPAALAQPTLEQMYQDDMRQATMDKMGNLGMLLMAASQQLTPAQRATILAQAPAYMDGAQKDAMTAAQARLYGMSTKAKQDEIAQQDALRQQAPALAKSLGISPELTGALTPEQIREMYIKKQMADPRESQLMDLKIAEEQAKIHALNAPKPGPSPQLVDLPGGGKGWAVPGQTDITPITGAGKGGVDPEMAKRTEAEDKNLTYAKEAITANRMLSDPSISGDLTSGWKNRVNKIPTLEGSWAGEKYLTGDSQANSFVDSVVRPRSGAVVGPAEMADKKRIFTPMPGDSQKKLFQKAQQRTEHIKSLIAGANPADRPMLQKMFEDSQQELLNMVGGGQGGMPANQGSQLPPGVTIRKVR
jgi:hypothetical protein